MDPLEQIRALTRGDPPKSDGPSPKPPSRLRRFGIFLARIRFLYLPLGLFALLAVGIHAGADTIDDRILWCVDHLDAAFDSVVGRFALTASWVHWVDLGDRVHISRALAFVWELAADLVLALPVLLPRLGAQKAPPKGGIGLWLGLPPAQIRDELKAVVRHPTVLRLTRPLCAFVVTLSGACAIGKMVQGTVYLDGRGLLGDGLAGILARLFALAVLLLVFGTFGARIVIGHLERANALALERLPQHPVEARTQGLAGAVVIVPLALAALLFATPLLSFFR